MVKVDTVPISPFVNEAMEEPAKPVSELPMPTGVGEADLVAPLSNKTAQVLTQSPLDEASKQMLVGLSVLGVCKGTTPFGAAATILPEAAQEVLGSANAMVVGSALVGGLVGLAAAKKGERLQTVLEGASQFANRAAVSYIANEVLKATFSTLHEALGTTGMVISGTLLLGAAIYAIVAKQAVPAEAQLS